MCHGNWAQPVPPVSLYSLRITTLPSPQSMPSCPPFPAAKSSLEAVAGREGKSGDDHSNNGGGWDKASFELKVDKEDCCLISEDYPVALLLELILGDFFL